MAVFSNRLVAEVVQRFWQQVADGDGYVDAGASVGWSVTTVRNELRAAGGVRPRRGRSLTGRSLTFREREEIAVMRAQRVSVREMARRLGRAPSTVSRELRRNADKPCLYRATTAHARAHERAARPKTARLLANEKLREKVQKGLEAQLSPQQIAGRHLGKRRPAADRRRAPRFSRHHPPRPRRRADGDDQAERAGTELVLLRQLDFGR